MRTTLCFLFLGFIAACWAAAVHEHSSHTFEADEVFLQKQQQILKLFVRVQNPSVFKDVVDISNSYNIEENVANYNHPEYVKKFLYIYRQGQFLPRGQVSSLFYHETYEQSKLLFDVFYYAKDYETFYKTAAWARNHVNEGIFIYAYSSAVYARPDTKYIQIPPPYEVYPYLFIDQETIQQAVNYYQYGAKLSDGKPYIITTNYTGYNYHYNNYERDPEQVLSYFTEDVGLNAFNTYFHYQYPPWYNSTKYGVEVDKRGELFFYYIHQILSRYFFERLSNNLGDIGYVTEDDYLPEFYPGLRYANGQEVPARPQYLKLHDTDEIDVHYLDELYDRIRSAIDFGFVYSRDGTKIPLHGEEGLDVLGNVVFSIGDNPNLQAYGSFYNYVLYVAGKVVDPENRLGLAPGALLQYATQLRDPVYYKIIHTIYDGFVYKYREILPKVTYEDLVFPGVQINKFEVDKLVTYYDDFYVSLNQVVGVSSEEDILKVDVRARQQRLNHRPYSYRVTVTSEKEVPALVRVVLVPEYDSYGREYDFEARTHFSVEIDRFPYKLTAGQNVIERNSQQSTVAVHDPDNFRTIYKKVQDAVNKKQPFVVDKYARPYGFPHRLLLPRGNKAGLPVRVVVFVEPYTPVDNKDLVDAYEIESVALLGVPYGYKYPYESPFSFELGGFFRSLYDVRVPNSYYTETYIYHKTQEEINAVQADAVVH